MDPGTPQTIRDWIRRADHHVLQLRYERLRALEILGEMVTEGLIERGPINALGELTFHSTPIAAEEFASRLWQPLSDDGEE